jgi:gamma-glutamyltranspeptidase/glutathione hydrolase
VSGWAALLERHGRLGLDRCLAPAIAAAEGGFTLTPVIAGAWAASQDVLADDAETAAWYLPAPARGATHRQPQLADTLRRLAEEGPDALYRGPVARAICDVTWLDEQDLADHRPEWVQPLRHPYRGVEVVELPPNGQGAAALQALGLYGGFDPPAHEPDRVHLQVEAMKLAFADAYAHLSDAPLPDGYLDEAYLAARRALVAPGRAGMPVAGTLPRGGTVYLCVVDEQRRACSFIQSLYYGFGSGVGAPGTGIVLQNRASGFSLEPGHPNRLAPGRRPFHTIIPGLLLRDGALAGPFGLMGGSMQPQGHLQLVAALVDRQLDPQAALDAPRWRVEPDADGWALALEAGLAGSLDELRRRGHRAHVERDAGEFGGGQAILLDGDALIGGSEPRKDGYAGGL